MVVVRGRLEPEVGALLTQALAAGREALYKRRAPRTQARTRSTFPRKRRRWPSNRRMRSRCSPRRPSTTASIPGPRASATRSSSTSTPRYWRTRTSPASRSWRTARAFPAETSQRLACDASRVVMQHGRNGRVVEVAPGPGRSRPRYGARSSTETAGATSRAAGVRFGQGHHIRHWAQGGPTTLSNLALLCRRHHRAVHEEGYQVQREPDGELRFRRPDGRPLPEVPPPPELPGDSVEILRARNEADGLRLHARTAMPAWLGERLDVGWAIDVLHPLALSSHGATETSPE